MITFIYKPNDPNDRHASQATIFWPKKYVDYEISSLLLFESLSNQYQGGQFSRIDIIFGKYVWTDPVSGKSFKKKWWAYYTSVAGAPSFESVCKTSINPDYTQYTFLVEATLGEVCKYTFEYWVGQAKFIREEVIQKK